MTLIRFSRGLGPEGGKKRVQNAAWAPTLDIMRQTEERGPRKEQ